MCIYNDIYTYNQTNDVCVCLMAPRIPLSYRNCLGNSITNHAISGVCYLPTNPYDLFWLVALTILKNMSSSMGKIIPYIMENKKCLKPPTSFENISSNQTWIISSHVLLSWELPGQGFVGECRWGCWLASDQATYPVEVGKPTPHARNSGFILNH